MVIVPSIIAPTTTGSKIDVTFWMTPTVNRILEIGANQQANRYSTLSFLCRLFSKTKSALAKLSQVIKKTISSIQTRLSMDVQRWAFLFSTQEWCLNSKKAKCLMCILGELLHTGRHQVNKLTTSTLLQRSQIYRLTRNMWIRHMCIKTVIGVCGVVTKALEMTVHLCQNPSPITTSLVPIKHPSLLTLLHSYPPSATKYTSSMHLLA